MSVVIQTKMENKQVNRRQVVSAAVASCLGWSFDLYDLFILLYVAPELGKLFFPSSNPILSLASIYASFAVTLLMRPIGSALFGSYADMNGRKKAMTIAVSGVGVSTALFGVLPTVPQIGFMAAVIFLVLRLVQGVFVGGVVASTHTIGTESVSPKWRGLMSGVVNAGAGLGSLFASIVYSIVSVTFPGPEFSVWGWRVMFFSGILSAGLGLFVFKYLEESDYFKMHRQQLEKGEKKPQTNPIRTLFTSYRSILIVNLMIVIGAGSGYYITSGFIPTFLKVVNKMTGENLSNILIIASVVATIAPLLVVYVSDLIGRKKTFMLIGVLNLIGLPYFYNALAQSTTTSEIMPYVLALVFLGNSAYAPVIIFLNERFPTSIRSTGTGLSWNIGFAIGGMMPTFISLASGSTNNIPSTLGYFAIGLFLLYLIGSFIIPETKGKME